MRSASRRAHGPVRVAGYPLAAGEHGGLVVFVNVGAAFLAGVHNAPAAGEVGEAVAAVGVLPGQHLKLAAMGARHVVLAHIALEVFALDAACAFDGGGADK